MRRVWLVLAVALAVGLGVAWLTRSGDDAQIRKQLDRLAAALHESEGSNPILRAAKLRSEFSEILDPSPHVTIPELSVPLPDDRRGLADTAFQVTSFVQRLDLAFTDVEVKLDDPADGDHRSAQVQATATLTSSGGEGGGRRATRPVTFLLWKREGTWRISAVTVWAEDHGR